MYSSSSFLIVEGDSLFLSAFCIASRLSWQIAHSLYAECFSRDLSLKIFPGPNLSSPSCFKALLTTPIAKGSESENRVRMECKWSVLLQ